MIEMVIISISLVALAAVIGLVYLAKLIVNNDVKEREMLVKLAKSKDLKEFEYIMVDEGAKTETDEIAEEDENIIDVEKMPDLK